MLSLEQLMKEMNIRPPIRGDALRPYVEIAIEDLPDVVADFKAGQTGAFKELMGFIMDMTDRRADGKEASAMLRKMLEDEPC